MFETFKSRIPWLLLLMVSATFTGQIIAKFEDALGACAILTAYIPMLEEKRICTAQDLAAYAANGELKDYWFLENMERGQEYCLEGFLFPDTYDFYKNSTPREVLEKLLDNFDGGGG